MIKNEEKKYGRITRFRSELETKDRLLSSIYKISSLLTRPISLDKVLTSIVEEMSNVFGFTRVTIFLINENKTFLECKYLLGFRPEEMKRTLNFPFRLDKHECLETMVAKSGKTIYVPDHQCDPRITELDLKISKLNGRVSTVAVPLKIKRNVIGLIEADKMDVKLDLTKKDIKLFSIFANQASIIIENARLYEGIIKERNFVENILESSRNGIITIDFGGRIIKINGETEELFGLKRKEVEGKKAFEVFNADIAGIAEAGLRYYAIVDNKDLTVEGKNGQNITLGVTSSLLKSHDKNVIGVLLMIRDLTETKKTEELIRRMDRLSSLGQLSAGIAHEIRNPLASINFNVQILSKKMTKDNGSKEIIEDTLTGINRINRLVKGIHDFAKPGIPLLRKGQVNNVIKDSITLLESKLKKNNIDVIMDLIENIPEITYDPLQMQQVFINLIINAIEAMQEGGKLTIKSKLDQSHAENTPSITVNVADTGVGIPVQNFSKIFDPFFTTKPEGTGLGLSITHKILEQHNAIIDICSKVGKGTTFIIRFPIKTSGATDVYGQNTNR